MRERESAVRHLDDIQAIDAIDGRLDAAAAAHVSACGSCRARVDGLRGVMRTLTETGVPEPSPLFWDHFPARVNRALDAPVPSSGWFTPARLVWGSAVGVVLMLVLLLLPFGTGPVEDAGDALPIAEITEPFPDDIDADEAWALVRSMADDLRYEDARDAGVVPRAGSIDRVAMELSASERAELARLIQLEMKQTGA